MGKKSKKKRQKDSFQEISSGSLKNQQQRGKTKKRPQEHAQPHGSPSDQGTGQRPQLPSDLISTGLEYSDIAAALIYFIIMFVLVLPGIKHGYDPQHNTALLMSGVRILDGQVPYKDFFPWYGPLFHYFTSIWLAILGRDVLTIKIFIVVISPLLSMAMFIAALRWFGISWPGRLFAVLGSAVWGMDRLIHCGSTRSMLGLFLIGLWVWGIKKPWGKWVRMGIFASACLAFMYSPDVGTYLAAAAVGFMAWDILFVLKNDRRQKILSYGFGAFFAGLILALLYLGFDFFKNYTSFFSYTSNNMVWAYGLPLPSWGLMGKDPRLFIFFLPLITILVSVLLIIQNLSKGGFQEVPLWVPTCILYGGTLYSTTYLRTSPDHLLFALPPIMALLADIFSKKYRWHWHKIALLALVILFMPRSPDFFGEKMPFFRNSTLNYTSWKVRKNPRLKWITSVNFGRIFIKESEQVLINRTQEYQTKYGEEGLVFLVNGYEAFQLGMVPDYPFDDLTWLNYPPYRDLAQKNIMDSKTKHLIIDKNFIFWNYTDDDIDYLLDLIAENFRLVEWHDNLYLYERRAEPVKEVSLIKELDGPFVLNRENDYTIELDIPPEMTIGYAELMEVCHFRFALLQRFSIPITELYLDDKIVAFRRAASGSVRLRTTEEGGRLRLYIYKKASKARFTLTFPGILNARPEKVEIKSVKFYAFDQPISVPYFRMVMGRR